MLKSYLIVLVFVVLSTSHGLAQSPSFAQKLKGLDQSPVGCPIANRGLRCNSLGVIAGFLAEARDSGIAKDGALPMIVDALNPEYQRECRADALISELVETIYVTGQVQPSLHRLIGEAQCLRQLSKKKILTPNEIVTRTFGAESCSSLSDNHKRNCLIQLYASGEPPRAVNPQANSLKLPETIVFKSADLGLEESLPNAKVTISRLKNWHQPTENIFEVSMEFGKVKAKQAWGDTGPAQLLYCSLYLVGNAIERKGVFFQENPFIAAALKVPGAAGIAAFVPAGAGVSAIINHPFDGSHPLVYVWLPGVARTFNCPEKRDL